MKSNQLNTIALLLLATAGISAVNPTTVTQYDAVQKALDIVRTGKGILESAESAIISKIDKNVWRFVNPIEAATDRKRQAILKKQALAILNKNATFVQRNKARILRNIVDPIVRNKRTILKAAAAVAAVGATAYAVDRYGFEGKGLKYTQESASKSLKVTKEAASNVYAKGQGYASWFYSKLPAKPTWLVMPAFVSNMFANKEEPKPEDKKTQQPVDIKKVDAPKATLGEKLNDAANFIANEAQTAKKELSNSANNIKKQIRGPKQKLDVSGSEMGF
jgi:hypothetical protein